MRNLSFFDSQIVTELINWTFLPVNCFNIIGKRCLQVLNRREQTVTKKSELGILGICSTLYLTSLAP